MGLSIQGQYYINTHFHLFSGAEIRKDGLNSTKFNADDRNLQSLFAQAEIRHSFIVFGILTNWTVIPALRWDHYSDVDAQVSPKLGAMLSIGTIRKISFRSNIGQSFRVPTFDDLYWPEESWGEGFGGATGNPNLRPETAYNFDVGVTFSQASDIIIKFGMTYFQNDVENLIDWQMDENSWYKPVNIGKAKVMGAESLFEIRLPNDRVHFNVSHTWMKATDESPYSPNKGSRLVYRPEYKFDITAGINIWDVQMNLNYRIVDKRFTQPDNIQSLPQYRLLNGNIGKTLSIGGLKFEAKIQALNLLDKSIYLLDGYPLPGREFRLTLGFHY
jgi:outer membrane cobalamin receptor